MQLKDWAFKRDQYIKKIINKELELRKNKITQTKLAEELWYTQWWFQPYIKWTRIPKDDTIYIKILKYFWYSEEKIEKILKEAKMEEIKVEFWEEIWMKTLTIQDNWQEPVTTVEEAEKALFKLSWVKMTPEALRSVRFAIDLAKAEQERLKNEK